MKDGFTLGKITMSQDERDELDRRFGKEVVEDYLERLYDYSEIFPDRFRKYKSHAAVVRQWIRRDVGKGSQEKTTPFAYMQKKINSSEKFRDLVEKGIFTITPEGVTYSAGQSVKNYRFADPDFFQKINLQLEMMGIYDNKSNKR